MKTVKFQRANISSVVHQGPSRHNITILTRCYKATWWERLIVLVTGRVWHQIVSEYYPGVSSDVSIVKPRMGELKEVKMMVDNDPDNTVMVPWEGQI